jgi:hypothetical protein
VDGISEQTEALRYGCSRELTETQSCMKHSSANCGTLVRGAVLVSRAAVVHITALIVCVYPSSGSQSAGVAMYSTKLRVSSPANLRGHCEI